MNYSTLLALLLASPFCAQKPQLAELLARHGLALADLLLAFLAQDTSPQLAADLETTLALKLRELGQQLLQWTCTQLEPTEPQALPARLDFEGQTYRRRGRHPNTVASLFGPLLLQRFLYEPLEPGERCLHPLELRLGVVAGYATSALAQRMALHAAQLPQRAVCGVLQRDHGVTCSQASLRKVCAALAAGLEPHRQVSQADRLLELLGQAHASKGRRRVVLAVGRDGIHTPVVGGSYQESSTATLTVFDRRGQRLGTVYLGCMPEPEQRTLSLQLTGLLQEVLRRWDKVAPRLAYSTDGGWHPADYYRRVLSQMRDPRHPERLLVWERVVDYYHAAQYVSKLAEALFGDTAQARSWARQMRQRLQEPGGVKRVLQSATWHRGGVQLAAARADAYRKAYRYLSRQRRWLDYARYKREGIPLGSGVTEAACKVLFAQRLKQSGMKWTAAGGQVIVTLRALWLSGVWEAVFQALRQTQRPQFKPSCTAKPVQDLENAA